MEAVGRCGLPDYTLAMTDNKCEEVLRLQLLMDKINQNSYHTRHTTWRRKQNFCRNVFVCKPWENDKWPEQNDLSF